MERISATRELKEAITARRETKAIAELNGVWLGGRRAKADEDIYRSAGRIARTLERRTYRDWVRKKRNIIGGSLENVRASEIDRVYDEGLTTSVTQEIRTNRIRGEKVVFDDSYLRKVVIGYTFDFVRTINNLKRLNVVDTTILDIARFSYKLDPTRMGFLKRTNPELEQAVLNQAILRRNRPEEYLENFNAKVEMISADERYRELDIIHIRRAVLRNPDDPRAELRKFFRK
jgi:hypothetical protein